MRSGTYWEAELLLELVNHVKTLSLEKGSCWKILIED